MSFEKNFPCEYLFIFQMRGSQDESKKPPKLMLKSGKQIEIHRSCQAISRACRFSVRGSHYRDSLVLGLGIHASGTIENLQRILVKTTKTVFLANCPTYPCGNFKTVYFAPTFPIKIKISQNLIKVSYIWVINGWTNF